MFHVSVVVVDALGDPMGDCVVSLTPQNGDGVANLMALYTDDAGMLRTRVHGGVWDVTADCGGRYKPVDEPERHATKTVDIGMDDRKIYLVVQ